MRTSSKGLALIKQFEGLRLDAYLCPADVWTIGYGHTSAAGPPAAKRGMRISQAEADEILRRDLIKYEGAVERNIKKTADEQLSEQQKEPS
jgi:lysozyme